MAFVGMKAHDNDAAEYDGHDDYESSGEDDDYVIGEDDVN